MFLLKNFFFNLYIYVFFIFYFFLIKKNKKIIFLFISLQFFFFFYLLYLFNHYIMQLSYKAFIPVFFFKEQVFLVIPDGISFFFLFLLFLIFFFIFLLTHTYYYLIENYNYFAFLLFFLEISLFFFFIVDNFFFLFFFLELSVILMFFLIGNWGSNYRTKASFFYLLYSGFSGSLIFLGICFLNFFFSVKTLTELSSQVYLIFCNNYFSTDQSHFVLLNVIFFLFFFAIAIKVPLFPFQKWLTEAHVEANFIGSITLAALMLKTSFYFFFRINYFILPYISYYLKTFCLFWIIISIFLTTIIWLWELDLKRIIACSSVLHMNFCLLILFFPSNYSLAVILFYFFSHSFTTSFLFFIIGLFYEQTGIREIFFYKNLFQKNVIYSFFFFFAWLANLGFPCTINFIAEFFLFLNLVESSFFLVFFCGFSLFFVTLNVFWMFNKILFSRGVNYYYFFLLKNRFYDFFYLFSFFFLIILFGIYPNFIFNYVLFLF